MNGYWTRKLNNGLDMDGKGGKWAELTVQSCSLVD